MHCCETFEAAQEMGFAVAPPLPAIRFCPWCGADVSEEHPIKKAAREVVDSMFGSNHGSWGDVKEAVRNLGGVLDRHAK